MSETEDRKRALADLNTLVHELGPTQAAQALGVSYRALRFWLDGEREMTPESIGKVRGFMFARRTEAELERKRQERDNPLRAVVEKVLGKANPPQGKQTPKSPGLGADPTSRPAGPDDGRRPGPVDLLDPLPNISPSVAAAKRAHPGPVRRVAQAVVDVAANVSSDGIPCLVDGVAVTLTPLRCARYAREGRAIGPPAGRDWSQSEARRILAADRQRCENILRRLKESGVEVHRAEDVEAGEIQRPAPERFAREGKRLRDAHELRGSFRSMRGW